MKCYAWWPPALGKPRRILPEYCSNGSISMPCSDPISSVRNLVSNLLLVTTDVFMVVVQKHHTRFESLAARKKPARGGLWFCSCRQQMDIPDLRRISRLNAVLLRRIQRCHRATAIGGVSCPLAGCDHPGAAAQGVEICGGGASPGNAGSHGPLHRRRRTVRWDSPYTRPRDPARLAASTRKRTGSGRTARRASRRFICGSENPPEPLVDRRSFCNGRLAGQNFGIHLSDGGECAAEFGQLD